MSILWLFSWTDVENPEKSRLKGSNDSFCFSVSSLNAEKSAVNASLLFSSISSNPFMAKGSKAADILLLNV